MKKFFFAAALIVSGLLVGCNQLTQYTVSEQEINQALAKNNNFSKDIGLPGVAEAHIVLNNLASQIGREEPNKVTLTGDANLDMNSLFGSQKATMKLKQSLRNYFNQQPAYILRDDSSQGEALAKKLAKGIEVKPGEIIIPFTD